MNEELKKLLEQMQNTFDEMKKKDTQKELEIKKFGEASQETKSQIDAMNETMTKLQTQINEVAKKATRIQTGGANPVSEEEQKKAEVFFKYMRKGKAELSFEEKKLVEDAEGQIIVPQDIDNEIYRVLPQLNVLRSLSNIRNTNSDRIRRVNMNELTVGWGKLETKATPTLANYESDLNPSEAFAYVESAIGLTKIGEDELEDSNVNLTAYLADSFAQAMADLEEAGFLKGTGHANEQPEGLLTVSGLDYDTKAAGVYTADDLITLAYQVKAQVMNKGVYLVNPAIELAMRLMKDSQGQYLWQPALTAGAPSVFNGKSVHLCSQMAPSTTVGGAAAGTKVAVFGDFNRGYQILDRKQGFITRLNEIYIEGGLIGFRYKRRVGGYVRRTDAFKVLKIKA